MRTRPLEFLKVWWPWIIFLLLLLSLFAPAGKKPVVMPVVRVKIIDTAQYYATEEGLVRPCTNEIIPYKK